MSSIAIKELTDRLTKVKEERDQVSKKLDSLDQTIAAYEITLKDFIEIEPIQTTLFSEPIKKVITSVKTIKKPKTKNAPNGNTGDVIKEFNKVGKFLKSSQLKNSLKDFTAPQLRNAISYLRKKGDIKSFKEGSSNRDIKWGLKAWYDGDNPKPEYR